MITWIQHAFRPIRRSLPEPLSDGIRSVVTAFFTPIYTFYRNGHFRSSFAKCPVDQFGRPLPWYTYPCIDFLRFRDFSGRRILEFGAGQSTLWWASLAQSVFALEGDERWYSELVKRIPANVSLCLVNCSAESTCLQDVQAAIRQQETRCFDIIIIDGLYRSALVPLVIKYLAPDGAIVCDNAEGYGIYEAFHGSTFRRIDFYGNAPGILLQHCTSIFFRSDCFLLDNNTPIANPAL